ncbi:MAG: hypothetical protein EHM21_11300 [Chloroflexi bacterium]|nr:MAG: hypothetical protein EHM21_11300 [Chloroflexota bacterium]
MSDQTISDQPEGSYGQLTQVRVPLEDAAIAFSQRDETGRLPIIVIPKRVSRIQLNLILYAVIILAAGVVLGDPLNAFWSLPLSILIAIVLVVLAVFRSFIVQIPEGVNGLLSRGGRYLRTLGSGSQFVLPNIAVSHLVTRRTIPFDAQVSQAPTRDNVRVSMEILLTFSIADPYKFIFNISADDFDRVLQASCHDALRTLIRSLSVEEMVNLQRKDIQELRATISQDVEPYGVSVHNIVVTFALPPEEFIRSHEARQLAVVQLVAEEEQQRLALQRQMNIAELARQKVLSDASTEALRLEQLQEQLRDFPAAAEFDLQRARIQVAQGLASNTRAMVQVGKVDDIAQTLILRDALQDREATAEIGGKDTPQNKAQNK